MFALTRLLQKSTKCSHSVQSKLHKNAARGTAMHISAPYQTVPAAHSSEPLQLWPSQSWLWRPRGLSLSSLAVAPTFLVCVFFSFLDECLLLQLPGRDPTAQPWLRWQGRAILDLLPHVSSAARFASDPTSGELQITPLSKTVCAISLYVRTIFGCSTWICDGNCCIFTSDAESSRRSEDDAGLASALAWLVDEMSLISVTASERLRRPPRSANHRATTLSSFVLRFYIFGERACSSPPL